MSSYLKSLRATTRNALVGVLIAATAVFAFGAVPMAAHAADVGTIGDLQAALSPGADATVTLTDHISAGQIDVVVDRDVTLDLAGFTLYVRSLTITAGRVVTLIAPSPSADFPGNGAGAMTVNGTLALGSDMRMYGGVTLTVGATGKIVSDSTPRTLSGMQKIVNGGTITAAIAANVPVEGNQFEPRFVDNLPSDDWVDLKIYAPTLAAAGVAIPTFTRTHATLASWNTKPDGSGTAFTTTTALSAADRLFYAQWVPSGITSFAVTYLGSPDPARAGNWTGLVATDTTPGGDGGDITDFVSFASSNPDDFFEGARFNQYLVAEQAGVRLVTATLRAEPAITSTAEVSVTNSGYPKSIDLTMSPTTIAPGETSAAFVSAVDEYDNPFEGNLLTGTECEDCRIELTSSDPTDVIDPDTGVITFTTLGEHTITVTILGGEGAETLVETAVVNVVAAPVAPTPAPDLPKTLAASGSDVSPTPWVAMMLTLLGLGAVLVARRRSPA